MLKDISTEDLRAELESRIGPLLTLSQLAEIRDADRRRHLAARLARIVPPVDESDPVSVYVARYLAKQYGEAA